LRERKNVTKLLRAGFFHALKSVNDSIGDDKVNVYKWSERVMLKFTGLKRITSAE
jgi:hypothetical protein